MPNMDFQNAFLLPLYRGEYDEYLDNIVEAVNNRKRDMAPKIWEFRVGDKVRLVNAHPKYLNGHTAEIIKVNRSKVVIRLDESASSRFSKFTPITTPLTMIEKVN